MKTIKVMECDCGEDVYEDDREIGTLAGNVQCINCGTQYPKSALKEEKLVEIKER